MQQRDRPLVSNMYMVTIPDLLPEVGFTEFSGIRDSAENKPYKDPFANRVYSIPTMRTYQPVELSAPLFLTAFSTIDALWQSYGNEPLRVEIQPGQCGNRNGFTPLGFRYILTGCKWTGFEHTTVDRNSEVVVKVKLKFDITDYRRVNDE